LQGGGSLTIVFGANVTVSVRCTGAGTDACMSVPTQQPFALGRVTFFSSDCTADTTKRIGTGNAWEMWHLGEVIKARVAIGVNGTGRWYVLPRTTCVISTSESLCQCRFETLVFGFDNTVAGP
tara:strand:- start:52 stop:420 length:369 start_codon:yes stop_codon:yes gene_type:complete